MPAALLIPLVPLVAVLLYAFVLFDRLLRAEYELHRAVWEADGKPAGFFWRPAECGWFNLLSHLARLRLTMSWLFRTPLWVAESPALKACLIRHRLAVLIWNVGVLIWFVVLLRAVT
jgi:hypothetical protein